MVEEFEKIFYINISEDFDTEVKQNEANINFFNHSYKTSGANEIIFI